MNIRKRIGTRLGITTIVILMVAVTALGVAVAATIPDSAGVIHGCYGRGTGNVRIVESASKCRNFETPITWQQTGEAGEQGPTGPQGPQGLEGPAGSAGTGTLGPSGSARETNPGGQHFYFTCSNPGFTGFVSVVELPVTLTSASTIHAFGHILPETGTLNPVDIWSIARAELLSGPDIVASRDGGRVVLRGTPHRTNSESMVSGPLLSASNVNEVDIAAPGSYTLRLVLTDTRVSQCGIRVGSSGVSQLAFQTFSAL